MGHTIVVLGAGGLVGSAIRTHLEREGLVDDVRAYGHGEIDITQPGEIRSAVDGARAVINCAAITDVDFCELHPELSRAVNVDGPRHIAESCHRVGATMIHFSTDFVFDGTSAPYSPDDTTNPIQVYGRDKLLSEREVLNANPASHILRTSAVFGSGGKTFISKLLAERPTVVKTLPHSRSHTFSGDLAEAAVGLIGTDNFGVHHVSNDGGTTFAELVSAIYAQAGEVVELQELAEDSLKLAALRPKDSRLSPGPTDPQLRHWRQALVGVVQLHTLCQD